VAFNEVQSDHVQFGCSTFSCRLIVTPCHTVPPLSPNKRARAQSLLCVLSSTSIHPTHEFAHGVYSVCSRRLSTPLSHEFAHRVYSVCSRRLETHYHARLGSVPTAPGRSRSLSLQLPSIPLQPILRLRFPPTYDVRASPHFLISAFHLIQFQRSPRPSNCHPNRRFGIAYAFKVNTLVLRSPTVLLQRI
jgi:hypothetical protein